MRILNNKNELIDILLIVQKNMPEDFDFCEYNGFKLQEDDISVRTIEINCSSFLWTNGLTYRESDKAVTFKWVDNQQEQKHFTLEWNVVEFVALERNIKFGEFRTKFNQDVRKLII